MSFKSECVNYLNDTINDNNYNNEVKYETYYYLGEHVDGCDQYGPIIVYHYISDAMRNGRNLNTIDIWDYDLELWPGDTLWSKGGNGKNITVEVDNDNLINLKFY